MQQGRRSRATRVVLAVVSMTCTAQPSALGLETVVPTADALVASDFNGDGIPDVASVYDATDGPRIAVYLGTGDAAAPFLDTAISTSIPWRADFVEAGDFDADGRVDLVAAARGGPSLAFLAGDGLGHFRLVHRTSLPGGVTALASGEVNRRDGLPDVAVAIDGPAGAALLVFESPEGAVAAVPERIGIDASAAALVIGEMDGEHGIDLVAAAGNQLVLVHGRDRRLTLGPRRVSTPPRVDRFSLPAVTAMAFGDRLAAVTRDGTMHVVEFRSEDEDSRMMTLHRTQAIEPSDAASVRLRSGFVSGVAGFDWIVTTANGTWIFAPDPVGPGLLRSREALATMGPVALLRLNSDALYDLVFAGPRGRAPRHVSSTFAALFEVDDPGDSSDTLPGDGLCRDASLQCTLRAAIQEANAHFGADGIAFDLGAGTPTIRPLSQLPDITGALMIDGATGGATRVQLEGSSAGALANGLVVTGDGVAIRSVVVNRFDGAGIVLRSSNNIVADCYVGTDAAGSGTVAGNDDGIVISAAGENTIGGAIATERNVISNNSRRGVRLVLGAAETTVAGNDIGTAVSGGLALPNDTGVDISYGAGVNTIGGAASPGDPPGNVIVSQSGGVVIRYSPDNLVQGNLIGLDASGSSRLGWGRVILEGWDAICEFYPCPPADDNTIGGPTAQMRNVFGSIELTGDRLRNSLIQGNYICTDVTGAAGLGGSGVSFVEFGGPAQLGGNTTAPGVPPGNVVSGCSAGSLTAGLDGQRPELEVLGNIIGTTADGHSALPSDSGVLLGGEGLTVGLPITIGGPDSGDRNLISGNGGYGVAILNTNEIRVVGNWIGVGLDGAPLPNSGPGIWIFSNHAGSPTTGNQIGGSAPGEQNVISGNAADGVRIEGVGAEVNVVAGNSIGIAPDGVTPTGNGGHGVLVTAGAMSNKIGGAEGIVAGECSGPCNRIANNDAAGVRNLGSDTAIRANAIRGNAGLGIDHAAPGVTPNDPGDADPPNFPVIASVVTAPGAVTVAGTLSSRPFEVFAIELFGVTDADPSGHGEGSGYVGSTTCSTDALGDCDWAVTGPFTAPTYTATSTSPTGWTSEFSGNADAQGPGEASAQGMAPLEVVAMDSVAGVMTLTYATPCGATDHNIEWGLLAEVSMQAWSGQHCGIGATGTYDWAFPPGDLFFVVAANNGSVEGSYGLYGNQVERPEDGTGVDCPVPQELIDRCDP